jgi:thiamine-monophosphate kinase
MIDISDGLSTDLNHICEESKVGAVIYRANLTSVSPDGRAPAALELALHGGEEYELLFTAHPSRRIPEQVAGIPISRIGEITPGGGMRLAAPDGRTYVLKPHGWEHFR